MYLEWAPVNTFETAVEVTEPVTKASGNSIFIKNLSFQTTKEAIKAHFQPIGNIKSVRIITNNGLPCGYGFVEFDTEKTANKALRNLNNSILDEHSLQLSESKSTIQLPKKREREEETKKTDLDPEDVRTKLLVKNLAFEATSSELKEVFQNYGEVKSVRLPTKTSGGHRGFAFIEFISHEDAESALAALQNTHLYGRRLVLDWGKEDSTLSSLKQKSVV